MFYNVFNLIIPYAEHPLYLDPRIFFADATGFIANYTLCLITWLFHELLISLCLFKYPAFTIYLPFFFHIYANPHKRHITSIQNNVVLASNSKFGIAKLSSLCCLPFFYQATSAPRTYSKTVVNTRIFQTSDQEIEITTLRVHPLYHRY